MTWTSATQNPPAAGRYAVSFGAGRAWMAAHWSPERGWSDGVTRLHGVAHWTAVAPPPALTDHDNWHTRGNIDG